MDQEATISGRSRRRQTGDPCNCLIPLIRIWGITSAIVTCGVGVDITVHGYAAGVYILLSSFIILLLEVKWIVTLFIQLFATNYNIGCCIRCWSVTRLFGGWRLAPLYLAIGVALILWPHNLWLSYVAGTQIILLAIFRLLTILRFSGHRKGQELLPQFDDGYDKIEQFAEVVTDALPEPGKDLEDEPIEEV